MFLCLWSSSLSPNYVVILGKLLHREVAICPESYLMEMPSCNLGCLEPRGHVLGLPGPRAELRLIKFSGVTGKKKTKKRLLVSLTNTQHSPSFQSSSR